MFFPNRYVTRPYFYRFAKNNTFAREVKEELNKLLAGPFNSETVRVELGQVDSEALKIAAQVLESVGEWPPDYAPTD